MEARVLNSITIVKGPNSLPKDITHKQSVERLAKLHRLVILISFGDDMYSFPNECQLPPNVRHINYSCETLDSSLDKVRDCLSGFGVGLISRHSVDSDPLPMLLTGSILCVPEGTELSVQKGTIPEVLDEDLASQEGSWDIT